MLSRAILKCLKCRATAVSRPQYFATRQTVRQKVLLPLWVQLGPRAAYQPSPFVPQQPTWGNCVDMSVSCQERPCQS